MVLAVGTRFNWVDPVRPPAALRRRPQGHPRRRQPDRARPQPPGRRADRGRRARRARAAPRGGRGQDRPQALRGAGPASSASLDAEKRRRAGQGDVARDETPIHPLRLCKEVRDFMRRDAILVVDGQEILNFGRQSIPTYVPGHRLNSGRVRHAWAWACRSASARRSPSPTRRWWCSTATAPTASTRWRSTPPSATRSPCWW